MSSRYKPHEPTPEELRAQHENESADWVSIEERARLDFPEHFKWKVKHWTVFGSLIAAMHVGGWVVFLLMFDPNHRHALRGLYFPFLIPALVAVYAAGVVRTRQKKILLHYWAMDRDIRRDQLP